MIGSFTVTPVEDGYLVGSDGGEWGGAAWWYAWNGEPKQRLFNGDVIGFCQTHGQWVAITHWDESYQHGSLDLLQRTDHGRWEECGRVGLDGPAYAFAGLGDGSLIVVTSTGLIRYLNGTAEKLISMDLSSMDPTSVVAVGHCYYVGMRHAVAEVAPVNGKLVETWLVPPK